ncbi:MAG TPA: hypothetical protein VH969_29740 [Actinophytocola sp.]|jgi:hypothetical protein|uniref:hypothetical protein n=1 Tax=Actinophytocola sp. TaxID=1872138 RepID=UPI002F95570F
MTAPIDDLWKAGRLPIEDAVFYADGRSVAVEVSGDRLVAVEEFDLAELLEEDPEWLATVDVTGEQELPGGAGFLVRGEGAYGSEGFFGRLDAERELVWVCYLSEGNPFVDIARGEGTATFTSTSGVTVTVDLDRPV